MDDGEKLKITLNIADQQVKTSILRKDEEQLRALEREVTGLWERWRLADPTKTKSQVLAMVAFQYAKLYHDERSAGRARERELQEFMRVYEEKLNKIVLDV